MLTKETKLKPAAIAVALTAMASGFASASDPALQARIENLEKELNSLKEALSAQQESENVTSKVAGGGPAILPPMVDSAGDDGSVFVTPKGSAVTDLKLRGRMHTQLGYSSGDGDFSDYNTLELRRIRFGVQGKLLDDWSFEIMANFLSSDPLHSAYIQYNGWDWGTFEVLKDRPMFGAELKTSSSKIKTVERSLLSNTFEPGQISGANLHGSAGIVNWYLGGFNGEVGRNTSNTASKYLISASLGVDLGETIGADRFNLRLDYIHNSDDLNVASHRTSDGLAFEDAFAASIDLGLGNFNLVAEYMKGDTHSGGDVSGFYVMPSFMITDKLEGVLRGEWVEGDDALLGHQSRYASRITPKPGRGDEYWAVYGGLNYYINKSVKLMLGVEFAELDQPGGDSIETISGWSALRVEF